MKENHNQLRGEQIAQDLLKCQSKCDEPLYKPDREFFDLLLEMYHAGALSHDWGKHDMLKGPVRIWRAVDPTPFLHRPSTFDWADSSTPMECFLEGTLRLAVTGSDWLYVDSWVETSY